MQNITPEQALQNLAVIADAHMLDGPNRRIADASLAVLRSLVLPKPPEAEAAVEPAKAK